MNGILTNSLQQQLIIQIKQNKLEINCILHIYKPNRYTKLPIYQYVMNLQKRAHCHFKPFFGTTWSRRYQKQPSIFTHTISTVLFHNIQVQQTVHA